MTIAMQALDALDADLVSEQLAECVQRVQEDNPTLDLRRGVFAELLVYYHAVLSAQRQANINDYLRGRSLKALEEDPDLDSVDGTLVDDVLSMFRLTRGQGSLAEGEVTVIVSDDVTVTVAEGSVWQGGGKRFVTPTVFTAKLEAAQVTADSDRLLKPTADGDWAFTITVVAEEEGSDSEIKKDTQVVPLVSPPNYVTSYAASDFTGGRSAETNSELLARLQEGVAAKTMSNRVNMQAMLREVETFSRIVHMSIIGLGNPEMVRDRHWIFPVSGGGRCDWLVRGQEQVIRQGIVKSAVLVDKGLDGRGVWQFSLGRDDAPGFYEVASVRPDDDGTFEGTFEILSDTRGLDVTGSGFVPDVADAVEAAYSRYQTATVQFRDSETDVTDADPGTRRDYRVEVRTVPLIAEIQDHVNGHDVRSYGADCLVKAPVPCFTQLSFTVSKRSGDDDPDLEAMKTALCAEVNRVGFVGALYASQLHDVVHQFLSGDQAASAIDMFGRIRYPDGTTRYLRSTEALRVPDDAAGGVTARTVQFFLSPEDVGISVATAIPSDD